MSNMISISDDVHVVYLHDGCHWWSRNILHSRFSCGFTLNL